MASSSSVLALNGLPQNGDTTSRAPNVLLSASSTSTTNTKPLTLDDLALIVTNGFRDINIGIEKKFASFEEKVVTKINNIEIKTDMLTHKLEILEEKCEKIERMSLLTDLILQGVPYKDGENLRESFMKICSTIDFSIPDYGLQAIFRMGSRNDSPIVLKFISSPMRNEFFFAYLKNRNISLKDIGFTSTVRIFIKESLTKSNAALFRVTMTRKKQGEIFNTYTRNGSIYVKIKESSKPVLVLNNIHLENLLGNPANHNNKIKNSVTNKRRSSSSPKTTSTPNDTKKHRKIATRKSIVGSSVAYGSTDDGSSELSDTVVEKKLSEGKDSFRSIDQFFVKID